VSRGEMNYGLLYYVEPFAASYQVALVRESVGLAAVRLSLTSTSR